VFEHTSFQGIFVRAVEAGLPVRPPRTNIREAPAVNT
jgi:hypothetical protein